MTVKKCPICDKGELVKANDIVLDISGYVFVVEGERCTQCGEEIPYESETKKIISASRRLGVWPEPLKLERSLSQSGNGLVLRIPNDLEKQLHLKAGTKVEITKIGNKMVVEAEN